MKYAIKKVIGSNWLDLLVNTPDLPKIIENLTPENFTNLVKEVGIEDSGELMVCATKEQIEATIDELMWQYLEQEQFESFSYEKFFTLLEVIFLTGRDSLVEKIQKINYSSVLSSFENELFVFDIDNLSMRMNLQKDGFRDELIDKAMESIYHMEVERFIIFSKSGNYWDVLSSIIAELNENAYPFLSKLLDRLCSITSDYVEDNGGLYEVLLESEQVFDDMASDREERRGSKGYVSGAQAKAFFKSFKDLETEQIINSKKYDWTEKEYIKNNGKLESNHKISKLLEQEKIINIDITKKTSDNLIREMRLVKNDNLELYNILLTELAFLVNVQIEHNKYCHKDISVNDNIDSVKQNILVGLDYLSKNNKSQQDILNNHGLIKLFKLGASIQFGNRTSLTID